MGRLIKTRNGAKLFIEIDKMAALIGKKPKEVDYLSASDRDKAALEIRKLIEEKAPNMVNFTKPWSVWLYFPARAKMLEFDIYGSAEEIANGANEKIVDGSGQPSE